MPLPEDFHICVQYYRQPTPPPEEWEEDLKHIKKLGFTGVQLRPQWAWHERREGEFCWDDIDRLMDLTGALGLKVVFKFFLESAPLWLFRDYEAERMTPDGARIPPRGRGSFYVGGWMPCFDRPLVRQKAERFFVAGLLRYRGRENLLGWHVWNEPRSRPFQDCACPDSIAMYRRWLAETFGSVEAFCRRFGVAFSDWEEVNPPPDLSAWYDTWLWRTSRAYAVADRIRWLAGIVRKYDPARPVFCHVGFNTALQPVLIDTSHDVLTAREVDVYGTSLAHWSGDFHTFFKVDRPALFSNPDYRQEAYLFSLHARWIAAVKDYFWINEIYGNDWNYVVEDFSADDTRFMMLTTLSEGARGLIFWQFKPERFSEESIDAGLIELDGSDSERSLAAGAVCRALAECPRAFRTWRPGKSPVALVYDFGSDMYSQIEDAESLERTGTVCYRYKESLKGWYSLLWQLGLAVDFIPVESLERIKGYRIVILPYLHLVDKDRADSLSSFVRSGGTLLSDPGLAFRDGRAWVQARRPGCGLDMLFGCRELALKILAQPRKVHLNGIEVAAAKLIGRLKAEGAGADLSDGAGLLVCNRTGRGRTYYFGVYPGVSYRDTGDTAYLRLLAEILSEAGLEVPRKPESVLVRIRPGTVGEGKGRPAAFVFNYEDRAAALRASGLPAGMYRCLLSGREVDPAVEAELAPREILFLVPLDFK